MDVCSVSVRTLVEEWNYSLSKLNDAFVQTITKKGRVFNFKHNDGIIYLVLLGDIIALLVGGNQIIHLLNLPISLFPPSKHLPWINQYIILPKHQTYVII